MANTRAEAFAPATVANLGVGFDILGLAVDGVGDTVHVELRDKPGAVILEIVGDEGRLPYAADENVASYAANALLKSLDAQQGVGIRLKKGLPLASGLGSSAASSVAAVVAVNALFDEPFSRAELLPFCLEGEALVSGYHADNVGPSLLGGITLITGTDVNQIRQLPVPPNLHLALVTPNVEVPTSEARAVLPENVSLGQMISQTGQVARVVDALYRGDVGSLAEAMEADDIIEPARSHLMPMLTEVRQAAKQAGAHALVISGAGPTLCAVCDKGTIAAQVAEQMGKVYAEVNIACRTRNTTVSQTGAQILSAE